MSSLIYAYTGNSIKFVQAEPQILEFGRLGHFYCPRSAGVRIMGARYKVNELGDMGFESSAKPPGKALNGSMSEQL